MRDTLNTLKAFTEDCREDMHEPDEQGIRAWVVGTHLDNAFGNRIDERAIMTYSQEYVVILDKVEEGKIIKLNLATLIALARKAKLD